LTGCSAKALERTAGGSMGQDRVDGQGSDEDSYVHVLYNVETSIEIEQIGFTVEENELLSRYRSWREWVKETFGIEY
jgi:hypothetical protein